MSGTWVFSIITKGPMAFLQQYKSGLSFSKRNTTKYHQQTVPFTALTMKFSFQILEVAHLRDSSRSQQDSPPSCPSKAQNGTEKSPDKQATHNQNSSSQGSKRGLFFPRPGPWLHICYKHNLNSVFGIPNLSETPPHRFKPLRLHGSSRGLSSSLVTTPCREKLILDYETSF